MSVVSLIALTLVVTGLLLVAAGKVGVPSPILLILCGIGFAFVPGVPRVGLDSQIVFTILLPPLLYASTVFASATLLRSALRFSLICCSAGGWWQRPSVSSLT